jgi:hypothetical protein
VKIFPASICVMVLGTLLCQASGASDATLACKGIADPAARLECYDLASGYKADAAAPAGGVVAGAAASAAALPATAVPKAAAEPVDAAATFGLSREKIAETQQESVELTGTVAAVNEQAHPGRWVVTLSNGQVWEQRETTAASKRPRPGDAVTIRKASLGSYMMAVAGRGSSRVRRIQ